MTAPWPTAPSIVARLARQAERFEAAMTEAVRQVTMALPALNADDAKAAVEVAVPIPVRGAARFLEELAKHMAAHSDALTSGDSHCPPVLLRLAQVLHDAGHPVVRPGCAHCGRVRADLRQLRPEGRLCGTCGTCGTCDAKSRLAACARCGRENVRLAASRAEGRICYHCYGLDPERFEACGECGKLQIPVIRQDDGSGLCKNCWKRPTHTCVSCGKTAVAALLDADGAVCHLCYNQKRRPRRLCGRCGRLSLIARNATAGAPDLCASCYRGPKAACSLCQQVRPCRSKLQGGPVCETCYQRHRSGSECARCARTRPITTRWPIGPVCQTCYTAILRSPAECPRCGIDQPLIARDGAGTAVGGPCVGFTVDFSPTCSAYTATPQSAGSPTPGETGPNIWRLGPTIRRTSDIREGSLGSASFSYLREGNKLFCSSWSTDP